MSDDKPILYSDKNGQTYTAKEFTEKLIEEHLAESMNRTVSRPDTDDLSDLVAVLGHALLVRAKIYKNSYPQADLLGVGEICRRWVKEAAEEMFAKEDERKDMMDLWDKESKR